MHNDAWLEWCDGCYLFQVSAAAWLVGSANRTARDLGW